MNRRGILINVLAICVGMVLGIAWQGGEIFPLRHSPMKDIPRPESRRDAAGMVAPLAPADLHLPVQYLPKYQIVTDEQGKKQIVLETGNAVLDVPSEEVALVLVDTWNEPNEADNPSPVLLKQRGFLDKCRRNGVTIIHAPNQPVVKKYPQYRRLRAEVSGFLSQFDRSAVDSPPFLNWPPPNNRLWLQTTEMRRKERLLAERPLYEVDISRLLTPLPNEYVLSSYTEFRYVLWKERINLLLYVGGSLNECMQHRDTGINLLAGIDSRRVPVTIVVIEDCSFAMASPKMDERAAAKAMLDYLKFKIAFVANSEGLQFTPRPPSAAEAKHLRSPCRQ